MTDPGGIPCGDRDQDSESRNQSDNVGFEILVVVRHKLPLLSSIGEIPPHSRGNPECFLERILSRKQAK